jgi:hypothetical protein
MAHLPHVSNDCDESSGSELTMESAASEDDVLIVAPAPKAKRLRTALIVANVAAWALIVAAIHWLFS